MYDAETITERAQRDCIAMAAYMVISVDIDAEGIQNLLEHAAAAVSAGIMTYDESLDWLREDLDRFVRAGGVIPYTR
jgi:hypothetical protein